MYFFYFFPLGLDRPLRRRPLLSWALMALMVVAFVWIRYFPDRGPVRPWELIFYPGNGAPWTAVTALFLHASWFHLVGNLVYFQVFAPPLEDRLGPARFLLYTLIIGVFGNLVHGIVSIAGWLGQGGLGVLGASGAIAGLLSFSLIRLYSAKVEVGWWVFAPLGGQNRAGRTPLPLLAAVGLWLLMQVVQTLTAAETGASVSFGAHLGGFAMGLLLAAALGQLRLGQAETRRVTALRYFRVGQFHAAAGAWTEYLALQPEDLEGKLGLARARQCGGQQTDARSHYGWVFDTLLDGGRIGEALDVFVEATRGQSTGIFGPRALARVAYYREKVMDFNGALDAYRDLHDLFPDHPEGQRALVRIAALASGRGPVPEGDRDWLYGACRDMEPGPWRTYLELELSRAAATDAGSAGERTPAGSRTGS